MKTRLVACTLSLALAASVAASSAVAQIRVSRQADRCLTAQAMGPGLSATGDLSGAENDSNVNGHQDLTHLGHQKLTHPGSVSVAAHRVSVATS